MSPPKFRLRHGKSKAAAASKAAASRALTNTTSRGGTDFIVISTTSENNHHIFAYGIGGDPIATILITDTGAGSKDGGIAFDNNHGSLYITNPTAREIVRYDLAIRNGGLMQYTFQRVPIAYNVDAEWITITADSDLVYTDPVAGTINKIYSNTLELIGSGQLQPGQYKTVSYVEFFKEYGKPSLALNNNSLPCWEEAYIFQMYTHVGHPSGLQSDTKHIQWGNLVDGYTKGTVVEITADADPIPKNGTLAAPVALSYQFDSIFGFTKRPITSSTPNAPLFVTLNGTLGVPPIPGDVVGALVAVPHPTPTFPLPTPVVMEDSFVKPRHLVMYETVFDQTLYIGDDRGVHAVSGAMLLQNADMQTVFELNGCNGMILIDSNAPAYGLMIQRGQNNAH